jgi:hypothetical protein
MPPTMAPPVLGAMGSCMTGVFSIAVAVFLGVVLIFSRDIFSGGAFLIFDGAAAVVAFLEAAFLGAAFIFLEDAASRTDGGGVAIFLGGVFSFEGDAFPTGVVVFEGAPFPPVALFFGGAAVGGAAAPTEAFFALVPFARLLSRNRVKSFAVAFFGETFAVAFFAMGVPLHW